MNVIKIGTQVDIAGGSVEVFNQIPAGLYTVTFNKMTGFHLEQLDDNLTNNIKVYGDYKKKAAKVMRTFKETERNLGVIMAGAKGMGKTLLTRMIMRLAIDDGKPVIMVQNAFAGVAEYLSSIDQDAVIVFDEFDKTFIDNSDYDNSYEDEDSKQTPLLTLFDGLYVGKKLFIITCNDLHKLNKYFINRPGRFHYLFQFDYPTDGQIVEYLKENVKEQFHNEISQVLLFSYKVNLSYDMLRAIVFELNMGEKFLDFIGDLNIINLEGNRYDITIVKKDGGLMEYNRLVDIFSEKIEFLFWDRDSKKDIFISFPREKIIFDNGIMLINGKDIIASADIDIDKLTLKKDGGAIYKYV